MSVYIQNIQCEVPEVVYQQEFAREFMKNNLDCPARIKRYIHRIYQQSGIETRYSVIDDLQSDYTGDGLFRRHGRLHAPTTKERNDLYTRKARELYVRSARSAIQECPNVAVCDITHVITVSCTGFFNPGPDYAIVKELGLSPQVERFHVGFMGCYAVFPALRMADAICRAHPGAVVLMVAVELCTIHFQMSDQLDDILSTAIFADGGAAAVLSSRPPVRSKSSVLKLEDFHSTLIPDSEEDMAWTIGDHGFKITLSSYVPAIIQSNIAHLVTSMLAEWGLRPDEIDEWAVHPGGRMILDKIEASLQLSGRLRISRSILRRFGNMSSVTILFVLKEIMRGRDGRDDRHVLAMAFGPGLTVEAGLLRKIRGDAKTKVPGQAGRFRPVMACA